MPFCSTSGRLVPKVDQVDCVQEHWSHARVSHVLPEGVNFGLGNIPEGPGLWRRTENLESLAADLLSSFSTALLTPPDVETCAPIFNS